MREPEKGPPQTNRNGEHIQEKKEAYTRRYYTYYTSGKFILFNFKNKIGKKIKKKQTLLEKKGRKKNEEEK